jgi:hypothetical protein
MFWHAHQAGITGVKSSIIAESASVEGLRRSLKTANQAKREEISNKRNGNSP